MSPVVIDQNWLDKHSQTPPSSLPANIIDYLGENKGAGRSLGLIGSALDVIEELGYTFSKVIVNFREHIGFLDKGHRILSFPKLPSAALDAVKSLQEVSTSENPDLLRRVFKAFRDVIDAITTCGKCALFIVPNPLIKTVMGGLSFSSDVADIKINYSDLGKASALESAAEGEVKEALRHTKNCLRMGLVTDIISIATTILSVSLLMFSGIVIPGLALVAIYFTTSLMMIVADIYKASGKYSLVKFDREVLLTAPS